MRVLCVCAVSPAQYTLPIPYTICMMECSMYTDRLARFIPCEEGQKQLMNQKRKGRKDDEDEAKGDGKRVKARESSSIIPL